MAGSKMNMDNVAQLSGVSRATVDRVLNKRPGVRAATTQKVERAIKELGYATSALQGLKKPLSGRVMIIVTSGCNPFFKVIRDGLEKALRGPALVGVDATFVPFDPYLPGTLVQALDAVPKGVDAVVTVGCDVPEVARAINGLADRGVRVITIISDVPSSRREAYVGQDNYAAGRTAARMMAGFASGGAGKVGIFLGHYQFRHLMDRMAGFRQTLGLLRPEIEIIQPPPYAGDPAKAVAAIAELDRAGNDLKGVYITGGGQPIILDSLARSQYQGRVVLGHELSAACRGAMLDGRLAALLSVDIDLVAKRALRAAFAPIASVAPEPCPINVYFPENLPVAANL